ncbi:MAG: hypothetical protein OXD49_13170 [Candidatus Poribacteria bacterium]|nr:hypothetical protein [Candidatus Poribacteria bacterium]
MTHRHILTCLFMLAIMPLSAKAFPPASPAGGNYLVLDGIDDYAVLDFKTFGVLLPKGTNEFTVEAWVYPTTPLPNMDTHAIILSQQVRMDVAVAAEGWRDIKKGDLVLATQAHITVGGRLATTPFFPIALSPNQWHHIVYQAEGKKTVTIVNDFVGILPQRTTLAHDLAGFKHPKDFTLGGFGRKVEFHVDHFWGSFAGYIDEVRISSKARYDVERKGFTPRNKFKKDHDTIALWHFDEPNGTQKFSDASGHAHHLVGEGGARTGIPLAVEPHEKLTTTWGRLKE